MPQQSVLRKQWPLLHGRRNTGGFMSAFFNDATAALSYAFRWSNDFGWSFVVILLRGAGRRAKFGSNPPSTLQKPRNELKALMTAYLVTLAVLFLLKKFWLRISNSSENVNMLYASVFAFFVGYIGLETRGSRRVHMLRREFICRLGLITLDLLDWYLSTIIEFNLLEGALHDLVFNKPVHWYHKGREVSCAGRHVIGDLRINQAFELLFPMHFKSRTLESFGD